MAEYYWLFPFSPQIFFFSVGDARKDEVGRSYTSRTFHLFSFPKPSLLSSDTTYTEPGNGKDI